MTVKEGNIRKVGILLIILGITLIIISIAIPTKAEIFFGEDDIGTFFLFDRILPPEIISTLEQIPEILSVNIDTDDQTTQVYYTLEGTNVTQQQLESYMEGIDFLFTRNDNAVITFPGYEIPECHWDYGTGQKIGEYWYNGQQVIVQNDTRC